MRVLGVFAKKPVAGKVKTRLPDGASAKWAARVHDAFLRDLLTRFRTCGDERWIGFAPAAARSFFERLAADDFRLWPQPRGDLGRRMRQFFAEAFDAGATRVVLIGSDSPTLPAEYVENAFRLLADFDVVLGPATDGGYYLIGFSTRGPEVGAAPAGAFGARSVFDGIDWSSARVLEETAAAVHAAGLMLALLPPWYDVDTPRDWEFLRGHVAAMRAAGLDPAIPDTERLLRAHL